MPYTDADSTRPAWGECRTFGDITLDSSIHCGAGHDFHRVDENRIRCRARAGLAPYSWRLNLCIESPGDGRDITLEVADFNHFGQELWQESAAVISHDGRNWVDLGTRNIRIVPWTPTGIDAYDGTIDDGGHPPYGVQFRLKLDARKVWFASPVPYTLAASRQHIQALEKRCDFFQAEDLGPTHYSDWHGFVPQRVRVAKPGNDEDRIRVVVIAGEHAAESAGMYACDGLLDELLRTHDLLSDFSFWVVPVVNVDGVALGKTYHNADPDDPARPGVNLNRDWRQHTQPENRALWRLMQKVRPHCFVNLHNGRHRREFELYSLPDHQLPVFMQQLRFHLPLPLQHWKPPVAEGMGCREVREAGLAHHALCFETLLLRKVPGCKSFAESYRRTGACVLRGLVAALREIYSRPRMRHAVQNPGNGPVRLQGGPFVTQLPSFYYDGDAEDIRPHNRYNAEVNGLPLFPGHYDVLLEADKKAEALCIARNGRAPETLRPADGWLAMRSTHIPAHKLTFDYESVSSRIPFKSILICPEGMPVADAVAQARPFQDYVRDTNVSARRHFQDWHGFYAQLTAPGFGIRQLDEMTEAIVQWVVSRQVIESGDPYLGAVYSEEDKYDARDAAAAAALFAWQWSRTGAGDWRDRALLARRYAYRNHVQAPGNRARHGGFLHMVHGTWGVNFTRLEPPFPGVDGVDTCAIIHMLCRGADLGLPTDNRDAQVLRDAADWVANNEVMPGVFLHHEGARHDCQNMNSLAVSALARAHATLSAAGERPPDRWLDAAGRGLDHLLDGQEAIGVWPYIFAQVGPRGQRYTEANIPDHGIGMYHLTRALSCAPMAGHHQLPAALRRAACWYLCMAWSDGDTIDLEYNKRPELGADICFSGFTWCRFTAAATLIRLARVLKDTGPWQHLGLRLMEHVRRKRWQTRDAECAPVVSHARPEAKLATWCQTAEWDAVMLSEMIDDLHGV